MKMQNNGGHMKKTELNTIIRKIVREEVAMTIQEVITEMKEPLQQINTVTNGEIRRTTPTKKKVVSEKKTFSSNSVINDVLNETANDDSGWETMGGETQTSQNMNNVLRQQYGDMMNSNPNAPVSVDGQTADFLTKDYSQLMQAVDKKAKQTRG